MTSVRRILITLLTCSAIAAFGQGSQNLTLARHRHSQDYPAQDYFPYEEAGRVSALSIVECVGSGRWSERDFAMKVERGSPDSAPPKPSPKVWIESVRVLDSAGLPRGATVRVVVHEDPLTIDRKGEPFYPMKVGHRYLVLGSSPQEGMLVAPSVGSFRQGTIVAPAEKDEVVGLSAFETNADALDHAADVADRIANSVVDCLPGASRPNVQRIAKWLWITGYPGGGNYNNLFGREGFPLTERIRNAVSLEPAYTRYSLFQVLCAWHVYGSEQGWVDSILDLAGEKAPLLPGDTVTGGELEFSRGREIADPKYVAVKLDPNRWADVIVAAKSDVVRSLLLNHVERTPDEPHLRALARVLLDSEDPSLLKDSVRYFSRILRRPEWAPEERKRDGKLLWINRDVSLAALRTRYGLPATRKG